MTPPKEVQSSCSCACHGEPACCTCSRINLTRYRQVVKALKEAIKGCSCNISQQDSGHLIECFVPDAKEALAAAEQPT